MSLSDNARRGASRTTDVWVYDVLRGAPTRLTFDANNNSPIWSPDGKRLVYASKNLCAINADGGGSPSGSRPATTCRLRLRGRPLAT